MTEFFTTQKSEEGVLLPLVLPDGSASKYWMRIRGLDSDHFRMAESMARRKAVATVAGLSTDEEKAKAGMDARVELAAELVIDWNFDEPCTKENVVTLFRNAPQLLDAIDRLAMDRTLFFALKRANSSTGSEQKSNSRKSRKDQKAV
jgi:hypothetical protein